MWSGAKPEAAIKRTIEFGTNLVDFITDGLDSMFVLD